MKVSKYIRIFPGHDEGGQISFFNQNQILLSALTSGLILVCDFGIYLGISIDNSHMVPELS